MIKENGDIQEISALEQAYPNEWIAVAVPEDKQEQYEPKHGILLAHSPDHDEVYDMIMNLSSKRQIYLFFARADNSEQINPILNALTCNPKFTISAIYNFGDFLKR